MKIGLLLTEFPNQTSISMWRVGQAIRNLGHDVTIISTRKSSQKDRCHASLYEEAKTAVYAWPPTISDAFINFIARPVSLIKCLRYVLGLKEGALKERLNLLPLIVAGASLARRLNKLGIEHSLVHSCANAAHLVNFTYLFGGPSFSLRLGGDLECYGNNQMAKFSNAAFAVPASLNNKAQIVDWNLIPEHKILATWLGVDTDKFKPADAPENEIFTLLTIARLNACKGHEYALDAMKKAINAGYEMRYIIAGAGPHEIEIKNKIRELGLEAHVELVGHVDEGHAVKLLQESDVFLLPSVGLGEASPVSLIEAMACGMPSISSIIGGTPQIVTDSKDGYLVAQKDVEGLSSIIVRLAKDNTLRREIGRNARQSALQYFSCESVANAIVSAIRINTKESHADLTKLSPIENKLSES